MSGMGRSAQAEHPGSRPPRMCRRMCRNMFLRRRAGGEDEDPNAEVSAHL
jgi:hypothetical protein